mmetsp:Transcript_39497/g.84281  ORF Transcript_39497/g.84281 Transcript_39497/m.84281 type:complete len:250 (-) Transcript_39497:40-789(-)
MVRLLRKMACGHRPLLLSAILCFNLIGAMTVERPSLIRKDAVVGEADQAASNRMMQPEVQLQVGTPPIGVTASASSAAPNAGAAPLPIVAPIASPSPGADIEAVGSAPKPPKLLAHAVLQPISGSVSKTSASAAGAAAPPAVPVAAAAASDASNSSPGPAGGAGADEAGTAAAPTEGAAQQIPTQAQAQAQGLDAGSQARGQSHSQRSAQRVVRQIPNVRKNLNKLLSDPSDRFDADSPYVQWSGIGRR